MRRHKMRKKKTVVGEVSEEDNKGEKRDDFVPNNGETTMDVDTENDECKTM